jgi:hypothetical protein
MADNSSFLDLDGTLLLSHVAISFALEPEFNDAELKIVFSASTLCSIWIKMQQILWNSHQRKKTQ